MIYQTDPLMGKYYNKYGCLFTSIAYARELLRGHVWTASDLRSKWDESIAKGAITGDLNGDGDMDDPGELVINDHDAVCRILFVDLAYIPGHHNPDTAIDDKTYAVGAFFNPRTNFTHFAAVGRDKKVIFDPIKGGSVTCREGYLKSLRLYSIL